MTSTLSRRGLLLGGSALGAVGTMLMPGAPKGHWAMDEMLRLMVLFFLGGGRTINITMPTGNNPHYS